jgi:methyl-accepting chemotaxis protein
LHDAALANANSDLSARTEQAAISLQKTSASVDQRSVAVKLTAESATHAASQRITEIIGVIRWKAQA